MKCIICRKDTSFLFREKTWISGTTNTKYCICSRCYRRISYRILHRELFPKKDKWSIYNVLKENNLLTPEQWQIIHSDDVSSMSDRLPNMTGYIPYDLDKFIIIDEKSSKLMLNQTIYKFSDIIGFEEGDDITSLDVEGPQNEVTTSRRKGLGRSIIGGAILGTPGVIVGGLTGRKRTTTETSGKVSYSKNIHEYVIRVKMKSISKPVETLIFHNNENEMREVAILLEQILSLN
jgi:hypothetical protein